MSATAMVVLLASSTGCVTWKHHVRKHSLRSLVAEKNAGRYYHCSHCGQIIPREGFSKCPRCFQVPAFHGYEPTCWRQWPEGWGCPPESVANNPDFWQQGMVESDAMMEALPAPESDADPDEAADENDADDEEVPPAPARVEEVNIPLDRVDLADQATNEQEDRTTASTTESSPQDAVTDEANLAEVKTVESKPEKAKTTELTIAQKVKQQQVPIATEKVVQKPRVETLPKRSVVASIPEPVRSEPQSTAADKPAASAQSTTPSTTAKTIVARKVTINPQVPTAPRVVPIEMPKMVSRSAKKATTEKTDDAAVTHNQDQRQPVVGLVKESKPKAVETPTPKVAKAPAPVESELLQSVTRVPLPKRKVMLTTDDMVGKRDHAKTAAMKVEAPKDSFKTTLVRQGANAIDATTPMEKLAAKSVVRDVKSAELAQPAKPARSAATVKPPRIVPRDQKGPIPVRRVKLTQSIEEQSVGKASTARAIATGEVPSVKRIAVPSFGVAPAGSSLEPLKVRRIGLSELPVRIRR